MRIFVTGATGWVGSVVTQALISHGHTVLGLTRTDAGAQALKSMGAEAHHGTLEDLDSLRGGAAGSDGVIHTAFNHDFSKFAASAELDRHAIGALADALEGSDRPLLVTSGIPPQDPGHAATEDDPAPPPAPSYPRASEAAFDAATARGVRASLVRLPPSVHGRGDHGFVPVLIALAREKGVSAYVGDGQNHWPAVHRTDAADAFRRVVEHAGPGRRYHAAAEGGVPFKDIATVIGRRLNLPVTSVPPDQAAAHFGWFTMFAGMDLRASSAQTRAALGWTPTQPGLLADIDQDSYFAASP